MIYFRSALLILGFCLAPSVLRPEAARAGEPVASAAALLTFGDWKVGCDNVRACTAVGLPPRDGEAVSYLVVRREGDAHARPHLTLKMGSDIPLHPALSLSIEVDPAPRAGPGLASWPGVIQGDGDFARVDIDGEDAVHLLRTLVAGKTLRVLMTGDGRTPEVGTVSLSGLGAALSHLDDIQHRTGTATALVEPGVTDSGGIPPVPPVPVLVARRMKPVSPVPETLPAGVAPPDPDDCAGRLPPTPLVISLSPGLTLWGICYVRGSYNEQSTFWLVGEGGAHPAAFGLPDGLSWTDGPAILENPILSEDGLALLSNPRGRSPGDCGAVITWVWTGTDFSLASLAQMDECRGVRPEDWPITYTTHRAFE